MRGAERPADGVEPASVEDLPLPQQWWFHVVHGKRCVVCGTKQNLEGHHVIERQVLKRELRGGAQIGDRHFSLNELIWHPSGGVPVCELCHVRHTRAVRRIKADELPWRAFKFAELIGLSHRVGDRYYPRDNH